MEHILTWVRVPTYHASTFTVGKEYPLTANKDGMWFSFINDKGTRSNIKTLHHYSSGDMEWVTRPAGPINVEELL